MAATIALDSRWREFALGSIRRVRLGDPRKLSAEWYLSRGLSHFGKGRLDAALTAFDRAIAKDANFSLAHLWRGNSLLELGRFDEAITALDQAIGIGLLPTDSDDDDVLGLALLLRGTALLKDGRTEDAISALARAVEISVDAECRAVGEGTLASAYQALGCYDKALAAADRAIALQPHVGWHEARNDILRDIRRSKSIAENNAAVDAGTSSRDDPIIVDTAEAIEAARAMLSRVFPAERVGKALEDLATGGESAGTDDPATVALRPAQPAAKVSAPAALEWPEEQWLKSDEKAFHRDHGIIAYLRRVWGPLLEQGVVITRPLLKLKDAEAAKALGKYLESNPLPHDLRILKDEDLKELLTDRPKQVVDAMHARAG